MKEHGEPGNGSMPEGYLHEHAGWKAKVEGTRDLYDDVTMMHQGGPSPGVVRRILLFIA